MSLGNVTNLDKRKGIIDFLAKVIILFFYIFEFSFDGFGLPSFLTSRRVAIAATVVLVIINAIFHNSGIITLCFPYCSEKKYLVNFTTFNVFLLFYTTMLYLIIGGTGELALEGIIRLLIFGIVPVYLFYMLFNDIDEFMDALLIAVLIQAIVICICLANQNFSDWIDSVFTSPSTIAYTQSHRSEYAGGIACITAPGLLKYSMGLIACIYKIIKTDKYRYLILYFYMSIVGTLVSRTGLFVAMTGMLIILYFNLKEKRANGFIKYILWIMAVFLLAFLIIDYFNLWEFLAYRLRRFSKLSNGIGEGFMEGYFHGDTNSYPKLDIRTIIGTGIVSGVSNNGVNINADGGFYRLYAAFGLPLCIVFYVTFFYMIFRIALGKTNVFLKYTLLFFVAIFLIGEFKEYTIYMQYMVCLFFTISLLDYKSIKCEDNIDGI